MNIPQDLKGIGSFPWEHRIKNSGRRSRISLDRMYLFLAFADLPKTGEVHYYEIGEIV